MVNFLRVKIDEWKEEKRFFLAFSSQQFHRVDRALKNAYLLENPYRICRKYLQKEGVENIYQYGETPLRLMFVLAKFAELTSQDHFFELGAGRGRTSFFIHHFFKCKVTAIEKIPVFVKKARQIIERFSLHIDFIQDDFLYRDLSLATVIYLYGSSLDDAVIKKLCEKIPKGAKVITASYPLSDYSSRFVVLKTMRVCYPWGETEVYLNQCQ